MYRFIAFTLMACTSPPTTSTDLPTPAGSAVDLEIVGADLVTALSFSEQGARVDDLAKSWFIGIEHSTYGRTGSLRQIPEARPLEVDGRVVYDTAGIRSWYENREDGLEQGFDILERPSGDGPVRVEMALDTDLLPVLRPDAQALMLLDEAGLVEVEIDSLFANDADGLELTSWMELDCPDTCVLSLVVDDSEAAYPIVIDPRVYANVQVVDKPFSGNPSSEEFGYAVAIAGNRAVVGDPGYSANPDTDLGAVHVYRRQNNGIWVKEADIVGGVDEDDRFGTSVDIAANRIVVGAIGNERAFVYTRSGSAWPLEATLVPPSGVTGEFGGSVTISDDTVVVGAPTASGGEGRAVTYDRTGSTWSAGTELPLPGGSLNANDFFGTSVAIDGSTLAVGIPRSDAAAGNAGALAIYTRSAGTWSFQIQLTASDASGNQYLGSSVALLGDTVVTGAPATGNTLTGSVYVFVGSGSTWSQQARLTPSGTVSPAGSRFGSSVGLRLNQVAVGASRHGPSRRGAAYTFYRNGAAWAQGSVLQTGNPNNQSEGFAIDLGTTDVVTGAPFGSSKGKVYIYRVQNDTDGDGWTACSALVVPPCDCNDNDELIHPDRPEIELNLVDENCDGLLAACGTAAAVDCDTELVITEVFASPRSGADAERWIELQNTSGHRVDLRFSQLAAESVGGLNTNTAQMMTNIVVEPGGFQVLAGSTSAAANGGITGAALFPATFTLYDDVEVVEFRRATSLAMLDSVILDDEYSSGVTPPVGASFSVDPTYAAAADNDVAFRWCDGAEPYGTGQFGTPGAANGACDASLCFLAQYVYTSDGTLFNVNNGFPIRIDFAFDPDGTAGNVGVGVAPFDLARWFTSSNSGEGEFTRTTTDGGVSGQTLEFRYLFVDSFGQPADFGSVYTGLRPFGGVMTGGSITPPIPSPFSSGSWTAVPCL